MRNSLDNLDAMCTVTVTLDQTPKREYLKTNSSPRIQIKSVVPDKKANRLQVTFEVSAIGSKPLAISQRWFNSIIVGRDASSDRTFSADFPKGTPEFISILPDKPAVLGAIVRIDPTQTGNFICRQVTMPCGFKSVVTSQTEHVSTMNGKVWPCSPMTTIFIIKSGRSQTPLTSPCATRRVRDLLAR